MNKIVKNIIQNRTTCVFVSPHLDDAVFSAGGIISTLAGKVPVVVINVFTSSGDGVSTLSAKAFLRQCKANSPGKLFSDRKNEDRRALAALNIRPVNLEMTESLWRKDKKPDSLAGWLGKLLPELVSIYPTYRLHISSGKLSEKDRRLATELKREIGKYLPKDDNFVVFCPLGIGKHVDHILVRDACKSFAPRVIYWADFPYLLDHTPDKTFISQNRIKATGFLTDMTDRVNLSRMYKTQFKLVIRHPETLELPEIYYTYED